MLSRSFAAALILTTGTAAAGGSYLAMRQNASEAAHAASPAAIPVQNGGEGPAIRPTSPAPVDTARPEPPVEALRPTPSVETDGPRRPAPPRRSVPAPRRVQQPEPTRLVAVEAPPSPAPIEPAGSSLETPVVERVSERVPDPEPAATESQFYEIVVPASAVIGLEIENTITSEQAKVEDRVDARVTRDVYADNRLAIPAGSRVTGAVTLVERGGKLKDRARLGVRFHTLVLPGGQQVPLRTEAIYREGDSPGAESSRKIGGAAIGGAVLGAILGGSKGAVTGAGVGAAGGTAAVMAGGRNAATLAGGAVVTVRLSAPITLEVDR